MTIKDAVLKSLDEIKVPSNYNEVCDYIIKNNFCDFSNSQTPNNTISARLGQFIKEGDARVKRIKNGKSYLYYLSKNEKYINPDEITESVIRENFDTNQIKIKSFIERDLHILLSSYLKNTDIYSKTILHEHSTNSKDSNLTWTHPDMVGIKFLNLQTKVSQNFLKSINRVDTFKLSSYELKKEIISDSDLKKAFFQAVSNSSWSNFGYLVVYDFNDSLFDEMERLNQSFGIGLIQLNSNPYKSKLLFPPKYRELDFKTIDKLCNINKDFKQFIEQVDKLMKAEDQYYAITEKELDEFCDNYFKNDSDIEKYRKEKNIPI